MQSSRATILSVVEGPWHDFLHPANVHDKYLCKRLSNQFTVFRKIEV
jgi:hypothetical protein